MGDPHLEILTLMHFGTPYLASCLVFDVENQRWDENTMRRYYAVVTLKNIGNYLVGGSVNSNTGRTTDFLAKGSQEWVAGPETPVIMYHPCTVVIGEGSFLAIFGNTIREYQVDIENPTTDVNWQEGTKWPQLKKRREWQPGCAKTGGRVIISGGYYGGETFKSTEILYLETRKIESAGNLATPRDRLQMATILKLRTLNRKLKILTILLKQKFLKLLSHFWVAVVLNAIVRQATAQQIGQCNC